MPSIVKFEQTFLTIHLYPFCYLNSCVVVPALLPNVKQEYSEHWNFVVSFSNLHDSIPFNKVFQCDLIKWIYY